jgi:hypothetical protein
VANALHETKTICGLFHSAFLPKILTSNKIRKSLPFAPVRHDEKVHAVADVSNKHVGIVFFEGDNCLGISSDAPALVFRKGDSSGGVVTIQDPLHVNKKLHLTAEGVEGRIANPDSAVVVNRKAEGATGIEVSSVLGRIYRLGYGAAGAALERAPRKDLDLSSYENFKVQADSDPEKSIITVHLPDDAIGKEYKLSVHFSKSQRFHDFTEEDVIDRPSRNTVHYRWERDPAIGPPVFSEYLKLSHGNFKVMLVTDMIIVEDNIKVPDFRDK